MTDLLAQLQLQRENIELAIQRSNVIAACMAIPNKERALLAGGIDQITADHLARNGWHDDRKKLRRYLTKLDARIAGLLRYQETQRQRPPDPDPFNGDETNGLGPDPNDW